MKTTLVELRDERADTEACSVDGTAFCLQDWPEIETMRRKFKIVG